MIRRATGKDLATAVRFAKEFHAESVHSWIPVRDEDLVPWMSSLIENGAVFLSEHGIIGGVMAPLYFNAAFMMAVELFWWAPQEGRALREAYEAWAKEQGASVIQFSGQRNDRSETVEKLFRRAGYEPVETGFMKRL